MTPTKDDRLCGWPWRRFSFHTLDRPTLVPFGFDAQDCRATRSSFVWSKDKRFFVFVLLNVPLFFWSLELLMENSSSLVRGHPWFSSVTTIFRWFCGRCEWSSLSSNLSQTPTSLVCSGPRFGGLTDGSWHRSVPFIDFG